ncbi:hypothetical protein A1356_22480 [Methylomonas koyamae]|uniref:Uncharacterized protein n=1 Tax=Methylomonas koyamae TaxID=702114 RepID=A0AA91I817_9GAMM|nr:hypothetical protein A1356_22480 [Methylomonas koyamae]
MAYLWGIIEERDDAAPVAPPYLNNRRVIPVPSCLEFSQLPLSLCHGGRLVYSFEIAGDLFAHFPTDIVQTVADQVNDTQLDGGFRPSSGVLMVLVLVLFVGINLT